ncbi:hypothetical protein EFN12_06590 [Pediococcus pentosaceus]|jgi:hypothetical protein|uniref:Uncharacterized protein n=1 Tax=Pediococcus pentosaceus (strain ATCC 25745 / CCUG 21536 / LMG 10740 / 183-1w) TaxID=278197 RepID=Q03E29_PEDPA|nr:MULTISPECIES: hypothetical protein [Pediococcus]ABJ68543.1 hypothetical protein PEPE_1512 [Pediococcus pentosaceus ATCC 25745]KAF5439562.1 hypothetical protein HFC69_06350 [Pediococcus sp. EKM202D]KAF5439858.1 hypothetical protein HFC68_06340 [Pediococcus sp. EKM201D]MBM9929760.1 hypothetical protein [Pediococcus pentosaceus]MCT3024256.1 hypothetical protein [Pediococcus pentosaceus]
MFNFSISWLIFWMKGRVEVDNQSVRSRIPRLLLWVFPYGLISKDIALSDIKSTSIKGKNQFFPLLLGLILIVLGALSAMNKGLAIGILAIIIGLILGIAGFKARLTIETATGRFNIDVPASQKEALFKIEREIQNRQKQPEPKIKENQVLEEL